MNAIDTQTVRRDDAAAAWLGLMAPGTLVTSGVVLLALLAAPSLTTLVHLSTVVRVVVAALLCAHISATAWVVQHPERGSLARWLLGLLVVDALLAGFFVGAEQQLLGLSSPILLGVLALSVVAGGWPAAVYGAFAAGLGATAAIILGVSMPSLTSMAFSFSSALSIDASLPGGGFVQLATPHTLLNVEPAFAGEAIVAGAGHAFPTLLNVEWLYAGALPARAISALFTPAAAMVLVALGSGLAVDVWRIRRATQRVAQPAHDTSI